MKKVNRYKVNREKIVKSHREKDITIVHNISVDSCIADEIEKLNNIGNILTLSSCCGHGETGYIIVAGRDMQLMIKLGYGMTTLKYIDNEFASDLVTCAFKPKSKCICKIDLKENNEH